MQHITINHDEIRKWSEKHGGMPALIDYRESKGNHIGIRLDFPGKNDEDLLGNNQQVKNITWEEFFEIFEKQQLSFVYDDDINNEDPTGLYRFLNRNPLDI